MCVCTYVRTCVRKVCAYMCVCLFVDELVIYHEVTHIDTINVVMYIVAAKALTCISGGLDVMILMS